MKDIYIIPREFKIENGVLDVSVENLTSLSELPDGLLKFDCSNNELKLLPTLPSTLKTLNCAYNDLTFLPELPDGLVYLYCDHNPLECIIPERFLVCQDSSWLGTCYYPFIKSYKGQRLILSEFPSQCSELMKQVKVSKKIRNEFRCLVESCEMGLI